MDTVAFIYAERERIAMLWNAVLVPTIVVLSVHSCAVWRERCRMLEPSRIQKKKKQKARERLI